MRNTGSDIVLECEVEANPRPRVKWTRHGSDEDLEESDSVRS